MQRIDFHDGEEMYQLPVSREFTASAMTIEHNKRRLTLRPLRVTDAPEIVSAIAESQFELKKFMAWAHLPQTLETQIKRIRKSVSVSLEGGEFFTGLFDERNTFLAASGLHASSPMNSNSFETGYWCRTSQVNNGLATLSAQMLIVYAFEALGCDLVTIAHNIENIGSERVVKKCGFRNETTRRHLVGAVNKDHVSAGLSSCRICKTYELLPADISTLSWYEDLRNRIRVFDQLEQDRGFLWRRQK